MADSHRRTTIPIVYVWNRFAIVRIRISPLRRVLAAVPAMVERERHTAIAQALRKWLTSEPPLVAQIGSALAR
jgi:hypothetical protein